MNKILTRAIDCLEILNKRPRPMCRDCADEDGVCPNGGLDCDMGALIRNARAAIGAEQLAQGRDEHAEFEAWFKNHSLGRGLLERASRGPGYMAIATTCAWHAWQASRAALGAKQPEGEAAPQAVEAPYPKTLQEALKEIATGYFINTECERAEHVFGMVKQAMIEPQPMEALGSIDTREFQCLLDSLRLAVTLPTFNQRTKFLIDYIDASRREAWEAGRAYGVAQTTS